MIIVSACLAGLACRYDGKSKINSKIIELIKTGKAIPVCPEQLGGLPTPRESAEQLGNKIVTKTGEDITNFFEKGAHEVLNFAKNIGATQAILKSKSPSCGCGKIYDGTFSGTLIDGDGITAKLLKQIGIKVITENDL